MESAVQGVASVLEDKAPLVRLKCLRHGERSFASVKVKTGSPCGLVLFLGTGLHGFFVREISEISGQNKKKR